MVFFGLKNVLRFDQHGDIPTIGHKGDRGGLNRSRETDRLAHTNPTNDRPFDVLALGRHGVCAFLAFLQAVEEMLVGLACVLDGLLWRAFGDF